jgi:integrase
MAPAAATPDTPTLRDWLEVRYLPNHALEHAPKTHVQELYLASWLATILGDRKLHEITTNVVEQYKHHRLTTPTERLGRPVAASTVNGELRVLSSALRYAADLEVLRTPLPKMRQVPGRAPPKRYLLPEEVERLLAAAKEGDPRTWLLALVLANMGFRPSEAMTREWGDVDWDAGGTGVIRITHKPAIAWFVKGGRARRGRERSVPMTPEVREALRAAWEAAGCPAKGWVFPGRRDPTRPQQECINGIQAAARRAGLQVSVHPHLFRHAWASRLAMAGVDRKSLQELGGWSDGRMLDEVYAHVTPDHLSAIMARSGIGGRRSG